MSDGEIQRLIGVVERISDNSIARKQQTLRDVRRKIDLLEKLVARLPQKKRDQILCAFFYEIFGLVGNLKVVAAGYLTADEKRAAKRSGDTRAILEVLRKDAAFAFGDEHEWE